MPLPPPEPRSHIHTRHVDCRGYRRDDGLWEIEGHLTDTKTYPFDTEFNGHVEAGQPVHDMWVRLTLDDGLTIVGVQAVTDRSPFPICPLAASNLERLAGLAIKAGFLSKVRELLGGVEGCTHLVELMGPLATTAFQTIVPYRERMRRERGETSRVPGRRPRLLNSCYAFASDREVVRRLWPDFFTGE